ncbi:hypothetical protein MMC08_004393 [Hypocenomyce scalaris]|nr:hypothetical protein [Hypocenomyce scalaris]
MVHGFYASMGGYVFEKDSWDLDDGSKTFPEGQVRLTLTARGVALLAQCGHLPDIDQDDIKDKSKSDGLGKALVCVQGLWMIMQIIQRAAARLPITLLEFNTLAHVLCALLMYFLWWHKPQSIYEPTPLEGDWARALGAYMYMSSPISGTGGRRLLISSKVEPQLAYLAYIPPQPFQLSESGVINTNAAPCSCHDNESTVVFVTGKGAGQRSSLPIATDTMSTGKLAPRPNAFGIGPAESQSIAPSPSPLWPLAVSAIESYEPIRELCPRVDAPSNTDGWHYCEPKTAPLLTKRAHNWQPGEELFRSLGGLVMGMTVWLASMIYGGLHAMAWNEYFPSESEKLMWRFSSIYIASSGLLWLSVNLLAQVWPAFDRYWERVLEMKSHWMTYGVLGFACTVCGLVYGFARLFLVIEAFVSVRKLPAGAYQTADWTDVFPHL